MVSANTTYRGVGLQSTRIKKAIKAIMPAKDKIYCRHCYTTIDIHKNFKNHTNECPISILEEYINE